MNIQRTVSRRFSVIVLGVVAACFAVASIATASHLRVERSDIVANAVVGSKVAKDSLTGRDIKEGSLGTVRNADRLDGAHVLRFKRRTKYQSGVPRKVVFRVGGLVVKSRCFRVQPGIAFPRLLAGTSTDHAFIQYSFTKSDSWTGSDSNLRPGETLPLGETSQTAMISLTYSTPGGRFVEAIISTDQRGRTCMVDGVVISR